MNPEVQHSRTIGLRFRIYWTRGRSRSARRIKHTTGEAQGTLTTIHSTGASKDW